jgi:UDP-N-acetylmuramate--alanine ligase
MNIRIDALTRYKNIHMIGINGISMSGLAEILIASGYKVTGSDWTSSPRTERLKALGAVIYKNHEGENVQGADLVVYTAAVKPDNPEYVYAAENNIPLIKRSVLLGHLMDCFKKGIAIAGTHGKTTTTGMVSKIFMEAGYDPTVHIGATYKEIGGTVRTGSDEYFITEADEYTESFLTLHPHCALITNIDFDHADYYKDIEAVKDSFVKFTKNVSSDGFLILNGDCPNTKDVFPRIPGKKVTFGLSEQNMYQAVNLKQGPFGMSFSVKYQDAIVTDISLKVPGKHNVLNTLAAFACGNEYGIPVGTVKKALEEFNGTDRRFEYKGTFKNAAVYDDYAHHPNEIIATLTAAFPIKKGDLWCVFQPHTYTRTYELADDLAYALSLADKCIVTDIYAAREKDTGLIHSKTVVEKVNRIKNSAVYIQTFDEIVEYLGRHVKENDLIIVMGAGNIDNVAVMLTAM